MEAQHLYEDFQYQAWHIINRIDRRYIRDPAIERRLRYLSVVGHAAFTPDQSDRVSKQNKNTFFYLLIIL